MLEMLGFPGAIGLFVVSMFVLIKGSDWFVGSAEKIGLAAGISPFVIGVTLVAFGTSLPELAASIAAVFQGSPEIVMGNVVGSNITNILLVVGISAIVGKEIIIDKDTANNNIVLLLASALLLWFSVKEANDYTIDAISGFEAFVYIAGMILFLVGSTRGRDTDKVEQFSVHTKDYVILIVSAGLVYLGAHMTIVSIEFGSEYIGISHDVIALTCVALGTSLPEVVVSVTAVRKGKSDIAIGNVLGSNIFNTFAVIGIPSMVGAIPATTAMVEFSLPFMVGMTILFCLMFTESRINKWEGWMLVLLYVFFLYNIFVV